MRYRSRGACTTALRGRYEDSLFQTDHVGVTALHAAVQAKGSGAVAKVLLQALAPPVT
jgi:hypothetical protein